MASDTGDVMTIEDLWEYLKVSKSTLYKLAQEGSLPGQKVGKHWRFHRDVIDRWLASRLDKIREREKDPGASAFESTAGNKMQRFDDGTWVVFRDGAGKINHYEACLKLTASGTTSLHYSPQQPAALRRSALDMNFR